MLAILENQNAPLSGVVVYVLCPALILGGGVIAKWLIEWWAGRHYRAAKALRQQCPTSSRNSNTE